MKQDRPFKLHDISKCCKQITDVVTVKRTEITKTELFKNNSRNDNIFKAFLGMFKKALKTRHTL